MQVTQLQLIYAAELVGFLVLLILVLGAYGRGIRNHYFKAVTLLAEWVAQDQNKPSSSIGYDDYLVQAIEETEEHLRGFLNQSGEATPQIDDMEQFTALLRSKFLQSERSAIRDNSAGNGANWKQIEENMLLLVDEIEKHLAKQRRHNALNTDLEQQPTPVLATGLGEVELVQASKMEQARSSPGDSDETTQAEKFHGRLMEDLTQKLHSLEESKEQIMVLQDSIMERQRSLLEKDSTVPPKELLDLLAQDSLEGHQTLLRMERQIEQAEKMLSRAILATQGREEIDQLQMSRDRINRERLELKELQNCLITLDRETEMAVKRSSNG